MRKRTAAGVLWFLATWVAWSAFATFAGLPDLAGPILGAAVGLLVIVDPLAQIWTPRDSIAATTTEPPILAELT